MSGLPARGEDTINGVDVREQGSALRVATSTPHLVSLGTGRLSTAVTLHPIKQGRVTIGSDPTCDIYVVGAGVAAVHCRVENSHGVVTLYPLAGSTLMDAAPVDTPTRLSQGCMLTIGRSNYLRFNHPAEAALMKSVLPPGHCQPQVYNHTEPNQSYQNMNVQQRYKENTLSQLDQELDMTLKEMSRKKPPAVPRKPYRDLDLSDSDQEKPKVSSIMAKVSKFEYYAKQQKCIGRSQFYMSHENEISPKVFSSNSLTVNTPAKDVLGSKNVPNYMKPKHEQKLVQITENNTTDVKNTRNFSYTNVAIRNKTKIEDIVRNFDENSRLPKKINNDQQKDNIYGKINNEIKDNNVKMSEYSPNQSDTYGRIDRGVKNVSLPSPAYDRNPEYTPVYANCYYERNYDAEHMRVKAYKDRIKEEEQKEAETARLEEILNMCAEYERQIASGTPLTPTEKRAHNKIITNGSLPRSAASNNPNFVQTSDGYYKFETSHNRNNPMSQSLPTQRNVSSYENIDTHSHIEPLTPEVTIRNQNYENTGRMDEIGIPVFESPKHELSSPIMIRKLQNSEHRLSSPIGSPYENVYFKTNGLLKPKSPNTQSPRSRIKTTFAHKNLPSPQYFIFPTPPPSDKEPNFNLNSKESPKENANSPKTVQKSPKEKKNSLEENMDSSKTEITKQTIHSPKTEKTGIEKQLSLEEEIPMIDDSSVSDDIEFRTAKIDRPEQVDQKERQIEIKDIVAETKVFIEKEIEVIPEKLTKNKSFDDVKKELMADIPELEEFERDLEESKREKIIKNITDVKKIDLEADSIDSVLDESVRELKSKYEKLKNERKKFVADIHEIKCKMTEIRSQEDDILRELEMEKALIKGEYDSEIAILNIEQKKKSELTDQAKKIEEEIRLLKVKQEVRQNEMRDRVEVATLKVERIEKDLKNHSATLEELQNAQDILDNETKIFEDLEFQHLEEESELLANREDIQNEIILLTKKIDAQKSRILTLKSEANDNLTSALDETKILQAEYVRLLNQVEDLTGKVQSIEKELKPLVVKLNDVERTQSPDSAFYTDQTRAKSGEFGYSPQSSDSDDMDIIKISNFEDHTKQMKDKFNSIDQMSQSMIVDIDRRVVTDIIEIEDKDNGYSESPSKSSTSSKEKKGFWERNFDSLKRKKKLKSPEKVDIMSQSFNENFFYNNENIENDPSLDRFNSLRHSKKKEKDKTTGPVKSSSSSKIPTFAALGKIIKKDSFGKKSKENCTKTEIDSENKARYVKNTKPTTDNKYKAKSLSPDKTKQDPIKEEEERESDKHEKNNLQDNKSNLNFDRTIIFDKMPRKLSLENAPKIQHRKSCGDEPNGKTISEFQKISDSGKIPSQDDIDRISKVTMDAPLLSSDTDMNSLGKRTLDSFMEIERKRMEMLEEQGCQVIENEREKISALKRRAQDETKKLWDQKNREKSVESDCQNFIENVSNQTSIGSNQRQNVSNHCDNVSNNRQNISNQRDIVTNHRQNVSEQRDIVSNHRQKANDQRDIVSNHRQKVNDQRDVVSNHRQNGSSYRQNVNQTQNFSSFTETLQSHNISNNHQNISNQYQSLPPDFGRRPEKCDRSTLEDSSLMDDSFNVTCSTFFDSSGIMSSSSIEELPVRNSRADSTEDDKRSDDSRPLSNASDFSRDNILSLGNMGRRTRRGVAPSDPSRPLTRYLPQDTDDFDLRRHVESAGHQIELCPYVTVSTSSCRGYLHKLGAKFHTWSKRWFVFDRESKTFVYYWDKSEKKPRGGAYFQVIEEVYLDHGNTSKSPSPATTFIVKTRQRRYYLMAPSGEAARIWIDVIFTGAQGYTEYME